MVNTINIPITISPYILADKLDLIGKNWWCINLGDRYDFYCEDITLEEMEAQLELLLTDDII
jgi:hypothetical protein